MPIRVRNLRQRPWLILALVVPALLLRSMIPQGFMPAAGEGAAFQMQMCPGHAALPQPVERPDSPGRDDPPVKHQEAPCVFAAAAGAAPIAHFDSFAVATLTETPLSAHCIAVLPQRAPARANTARAPPLYS